MYIERIAYNARRQRTLIAYANNIMTRYAYDPVRLRRYQVLSVGLRAITALLILCDEVIKPILAGVRTSASSRKPTICNPIDQRTEQLRISLQPLLEELGVAA
jgi:hypothetical protein